MGIGGDKNSPKTQQTSTSVTKNTSIQPTVSGNSGAVSVGPTLSDVTNTGKIDISTTDQGAIQAGLQIASKALDTVNSETSASNALASQATAGQSNTSLKYILWAGVGIAIVVGLVFMNRSSK